MWKKWFESFYKYHHIYEFMGTKEVYAEDIKEFLMKEKGLPESTVRYQLQGALDPEKGMVEVVEGKYRVESGKVAALINRLRPLYPVTLRIITQQKYENLNKLEDYGVLAILKLQKEKALKEINYLKDFLYLLDIGIMDRHSARLKYQKQIMQLEKDIEGYEEAMENVEERLK